MVEAEEDSIANTSNSVPADYNPSDYITLRPQPEDS